MRIGLFTDTFRPSINGIVFVLESLKRELEAQGHEVYIFCPGKKILPAREAELYEEDHHIVRFPSIKGAFFDDYDTSVFFPPRVVQQIRKLDLDVIHVFTPSQVGLVGIQAATKCDVPFIMQHSTDLYEFSEDYPLVLPGLLALIGIVLPAAVKLGRKDIAEVVKMYRPRRGVAKWNKDIVQRVVTMIYSRADAVIALSDKSADQLRSWQDEKYNYEIMTMPNGVNAIPAPTKAELKEFRDNFGIAPSDEVFGFVGRLGKEKNLDMLIPALEYVVHQRPNARLLFVGDFEYRETLEALAAESECGDRITFTGALPREKLGVAYAAMNVFVFPSLKDTQGWVLHEAAHAGLPIVLIDKGVTSVVKDGVNGYYVGNSPEAVSDRVLELLADDNLRQKMGRESKKIAATLTEAKQVEKLEKLYETVVRNHHADSE
jgi:glycosyltransferase involved in cell wall biosynthesis